jgi:cytochrome c biogenesis protein CcdA
MLILLGSILNRYKSYKKMGFAWLLFILAIFISYFLMWLWIYKALSFAWSIFYLKLSVWILWLLVWLANIKDFFWYWKWFIMEVPLSWRPKMKLFLDKITSPIWAFFIWFIVSLFLLPCTSWPYLTILWYLASESSSLNALWYIYLFIYNFVFILPMIVIIFLVALWTKTVSELKEYKELYVREIHLVVWILMLILSAYIFYDLFYL